MRRAIGLQSSLSLNCWSMNHSTEAFCMACAYVSVLLLLLGILSFGCRFERRDRLSLHTTCLKLLLDFMDVADSGEEMRLSTAVTVKGCEPPAPFPFRCLCLLEVTNDGEIFRREEAVIDDRIILPPVMRPGDVIVWFPNQFGLSTFIVQAGTLDVEKFESVLFKDETDTCRLDPQQRCKQQVESTPKDPNQRRATISHV
mmetsp:Transcript_25090/g.59605  ORF Transcript_25090/g.59605 Transcript_25090/m.59605 type:complete len:200 (-) Transcript_25090:483-1082(-)